MARTKSISGYETSLEVSITPSGSPGSGSKWLISIVTEGFPNSNVITALKPDDMHSITIEELIEDFINASIPVARESYASFYGDDERLEVASLLESMAKKIRDTLKNKK